MSETESNSTPSRMSVDTSITYICNTCGYEADSVKSVKQHISMAGKTDSSDPHHGKEGGDPGAYTSETDTTEVEENNERVQYQGDNSTYIGPAKGLDMTYTHISERDSSEFTGFDSSEKVLIGLSIDQIREILAQSDVSKSTRSDILEQLTGL